MWEASTLQGRNTRAMRTEHGEKYRRFRILSVSGLFCSVNSSFFFTPPLGVNEKDTKIQTEIFYPLEISSASDKYFLWLFA